MVDEPINIVIDGVSRNEHRSGVCMGCGAKYSGNANETEKWRENHDCPKTLL